MNKAENDIRETPRVDVPLPKVGTFDPQDDGRITQEYVTKVKQRLQQLQTEGESGCSLVEAYAAAIDKLITFLVVHTTEEYNAHYVLLDHRCSILAQGGYGRRELSPGSDIDLLLLFPWKRNSYVETVAEKLYYNLTAAGIAIWAAARNIQETVRLALRDTTVETALLDARYLCGDRPLYDEFVQVFEKDVLKRGGVKFFRDRLRASVKRYEQWGDSVYVLQPNVKEGKGGLRDIHTASWVAKVKFKIKGLSELIQKGVIGRKELAELDSSRNFLLRVRNAMHLASNSHQDQLTFELQEQIAPMLGFGAVAGNGVNVESFMREYYDNAGTISRVAASIVERSLDRQRATIGSRARSRREIRPGVYVVNDLLNVSGSRLIKREPSNLVALFLDAQRQEVRLGDSTKQIIRDQLTMIGEEERSAPAFTDPLREILRGKSRVFETLSELHTVGVLCQLVPEFSRINCLIRRDPIHTYTVDRHSLAGIRELERLKAGEYKNSSPLLTQVIRETDDLDILYLGMLFHDIGKGEGHRHSERGAEIARNIAARIRLNEDEARQLEFLVRRHLLMAKLVVSRDTHDERLVLSFARTVANPDNLRKLFLLTFADIRSSAAKTWTNWRDMVLGEFYLRTLGAFERGDLGEENRAERAVRVKDRVLMKTAPQAHDEVKAFLDSMPEAYFLNNSVSDIQRHSRLAHRLAQDEASASAEERLQLFVSEVRHFPQSDYSEFTLCTRDRPGLFANLTGVLAANQMNIAGARVMTSSQGMVLDRFRVAHGDAAGLVMDERRWERVQCLLGEIMRGSVDIGDRVMAALPASILAKRRSSRVTTEVLVENNVSEEYSVLELYAEDKPGLLFAITSCLHELGLNVHVAKVTTNVHQVLDVFYVTREGQKVEDGESLEMIKQRLRECVETLSQGRVAGRAEGEAG